MILPATRQAHYVSAHLRDNPVQPRAALGVLLTSLPMLPQVSESDLKPVAQGDVKLGGTAGKNWPFSQLAMLGRMRGLAGWPFYLQLGTARDCQCPTHSFIQYLQHENSVVFKFFLTPIPSAVPQAPGRRSFATRCWARLPPSWWRLATRWCQSTTAGWSTATPPPAWAVTRCSSRRCPGCARATSGPAAGATRCGVPLQCMCAAEACLLLSPPSPPLF